MLIVKQRNTKLEGFIYGYDSLKISKIDKLLKILKSLSSFNKIPDEFDFWDMMQ